MVEPQQQAEEKVVILTMTVCFPPRFILHWDAGCVALWLPAINLRQCKSSW